MYIDKSSKKCGISDELDGMKDNYLGDSVPYQVRSIDYDDKISGGQKQEAYLYSNYKYIFSLAHIISCLI
jgi:hypothetical protein